MLIAYADGRERRVMLTRSGLATVVPATEPFDPDVEIRGRPDEVGSFLAGRTSLGDAILGRVVRLHIAEDEAASYRELRRLVAEIAVSPDVSR